MSKKRKLPYDDITEERLFQKFGIPTSKKIKADLAQAYEPNQRILFVPMSDRFYISSHGEQLVHPDFPKIKIPDNVHLYFQTEFGNRCPAIYAEETIGFNCYSNVFKNFTKEVDGNLEWINYCSPGTEIHNCLLTPYKKFLSNVIHCGSNFYTNIDNIEIPMLLSDVLIKIREFCNYSKIEEAHIFCSFCLGENRTMDKRSLLLYMINFDTEQPEEEIESTSESESDSDSDSESSFGDLGIIDENNIPPKYRFSNKVDLEGFDGGRKKIRGRKTKRAKTKRVKRVKRSKNRRCRKTKTKRKRV